MQKQVILDGFQNVVASGVAICDMNKFLGTELEKITLNLGGTSLTHAMITKIELKANSKVIWESDGTKLNSSNVYNGGTTDAAALKIDFMDRRGFSKNAREAGVIDLSRQSGISQLRLEVTISGATAPTLAGFADVSPVSRSPAEAGIRDLVARRHRTTYVAPAAGQFALPVPHLDPSGGGTNYRRIYVYAANVTAIKTVRDGVTEHELTKAQNELAQRDNFKVPQAGLIVFDPCQDGQIAGRTWDTRRRFCRSAQFLATFSAGETVTIETEELIGLSAY